MYTITSFETTIPEDLFHIKGLKLKKLLKTYKDEHSLLCIYK